METLQIALHRFEMAQFIGAITRFFASQGIPPAMIAPFAGYDEPLEFGPAEERDLAAELLEEGRSLYFPFSDTNTGEAVPCADGQRYRFPVVETDETELNFCAAELESIGFLVAVARDELRIEQAVMSGGALSPAEPADWSGLALDEAMERFIRKFIGEE
ncbi:hypothetical protein EDC14_104321 [Hydrogenispora ethanolica]|uniref:Uncharacterized protein n=1 Tax=Hydrogenispora ethanolica TaxID=1082276 RepID=A0A4R1QZ70_HYDET|nr:hypothetical protein [Hydrogenispora ethanolica]TCL58285.1 hypothetical protein EDC14_104321 [Hydrogenispora ethanolica]